MSFDPTAIFSFGLEMIFYVLLFIFTIHALFVGYHWFNYGDDAKMSMTALTTYLAGAALLFGILAYAAFLT